MDESTDTTNRPLTEIGTLDLCGERIKLGKNGCVKLVRESVDAWGSKYGVELDLWEWLSCGYKGEFGAPITEEFVELVAARAQALLDELGKALSQLTQARDSKLGKGKGQEG